MPNPQDPWDEEENPIPVPEAEAVDAKGTPIGPESMAELLINMEVVIPHGESEELAKVIRRSFDVNGEFIGPPSDTRVLNTCVYDV